MACNNCKVEYVSGKCGAKTVTCKDCGYYKTPLTHTMSNSICLEMEIAKSKRMKNGKS